MKDIKVLGGGGSACRATVKIIVERANALGVDVELTEVRDLPEIVAFGVMSTPGVVVDGAVVHTGGVPTVAAVDAWLR